MVDRKTVQCAVYNFEMYRVSLLVIACISVSINMAIAMCTTSRYEEEIGERLKCSNVTLDTAVIHGGPIVSDIMIFQSRIESVPDRSFIKYGSRLISLNIYGCGVTDISGYAFNGLRYLKILSLPYNNLTWVRDQWFVSLISLEQLDLSYNLITLIEPTVFAKLRGLKRLDVSGNRLTCLEPIQLAPMAGLAKLRFFGNPLTFRCRGTLTLWLRDLGINYNTEQHEEENWLDELLWLCAADDGKVADSEVLMKECIILNLFNQLRTGLTTAESYPLTVPEECVYAREQLTKCIISDGKRDREIITNGHVVRKLLRQLKQSKSTL